MKARNVVIVDGVRSAFSRGGKGMLEATRMDELSVKIFQALLERNPKVKPTMIEDFGIGNGRHHPDLTPLNTISRLAGLPHELPNFYVDHHCASSKELRRSGKRYGIATQCIGAGQGAATVVEALS